MNGKTSKLLRKAHKQIYGHRPELIRRKYKEAKKKWNQTPKPMREISRLIFKKLQESQNVQEVIKNIQDKSNNIYNK